MSGNLTKAQNWQQRTVLQIPQMLAKTKPCHCVYLSFVQGGECASFNILARMHPRGTAVNSSAMTMTRSSSARRFEQNLPTILRLTTTMPMKYMIPAYKKTSVLFDLLDRLQRDACTLAVRVESSMVQLASMHADMVCDRRALWQTQLTSDREHPVGGTVIKRH